MKILNPLISYILLVSLTNFTNCSVDDELQQAIVEVEACARIDEIEIANTDREIDQNFFDGDLNGVYLSTKQGFRDYTVKVRVENTFVTAGPNSGGGVLDSYRQIDVRLSSDGASGNSFVGDPLLSISVKLPCERIADSTTLSVFQNALVEGEEYNISDPASDCTNAIDVTVHPLCHSYRYDQRGAYIGKPFSSAIGRQVDHKFVVEKYHITPLADDKIRFELRATFSASLYYNTTSGGPVTYGELENAIIDVNKVIGI